MNKKTLKIVAATAMCIFTLFSVFSATIAWFEMSKNIDSDANTMPVSDVTGKFKQMTFHELTSKTVTDTQATCSFSFNKTPIGTVSYNWTTKTMNKTGNTSLSLSDYTLLDQYHPVLLLIQLNTQYTSLSDGDFVISANAFDESLGDPKDFLGQKVVNEETAEITPKYDLNDSTIYKTVSNKKYYWLSSAARFFAQPFSTNEYTTLNGGSTYDFTLGNMGESHFVNIVSSTETYTFDDNATIYSANAGDVAEYIAIIVDYYPDAVESIYSTFLGDTTLENRGYELDYLCDWSMEVL